MPVSAMSLFFALLALAANVLVVAWIALAVAGERPGPMRARSRVHHELAGRTTGLAAVVAGIATAGSLYYSEIAQFVPCLLCWVQRGFMYPLAAVLGLAAWRKWPARAWARVAALAGAAVSIWHLLIERFPALEGAVACDPINPCSLKWVEIWGFVTIPYMALSAFLLVAVLLSVPTAAPDRAAHRQGVDVS